MAFLAPAIAEGAVLAAPEIVAGGAALAEGGEIALTAAEAKAAANAAMLAKMAGSVGGAVLKKIGHKGAQVVGQKLAPAAEKGLTKMLQSPTFHSGLSNAGNFIGGKVHKLGNQIFGQHNFKTARELGSDAVNVSKAVAKIGLSDTAHSVLGGALDIGKDLDFVTGEQRDKILNVHKKAMQVHDALSKFNKLHNQLKPRMDYSQAMQQHKTDPNPTSSLMSQAIKRPPPMPERDHEPYIPPYIESKGDYTPYVPYVPRPLQKAQAPTPQHYVPHTAYVSKSKSLR